MLAVQNFAQAQNPRQAILCRCKISRSQLRSVEFLAVQMEAQNLRHLILHGSQPYKFLCRAPRLIAQSRYKIACEIVQYP